MKKSIPINDPGNESDGTRLCLACGLCCIGVFHDRAVLYTSGDRECAGSFGATTFEEDGIGYFALPCPVYDGKCPIHPANPSVCRAHRCDLLKSVEEERRTLGSALAIVEKMKQIIREIGDDPDVALLGGIERQGLHRAFEGLFRKTTKAQRSEYPSLLTKYALFSYIMIKYFYKESENDE
jgi:hypothetical protein